MDVNGTVHIKINYSINTLIKKIRGYLDRCCTKLLTPHARYYRRIWLLFCTLRMLCIYTCIISSMKKVLLEYRFVLSFFLHGTIVLFGECSCQCWSTRSLFGRAGEKLIMEIFFHGFFSIFFKENFSFKGIFFRFFFSTRIFFNFIVSFTLFLCKQMYL